MTPPSKSDDAMFLLKYTAKTLWQLFVAMVFTGALVLLGLATAAATLEVARSGEVTADLAALLLASTVILYHVANKVMSDVQSPKESEVDQLAEDRAEARRLLREAETALAQGDVPRSQALGTLAATRATLIQDAAIWDEYGIALNFKHETRAARDAWRRAWTRAE